MKLLKFLLFPFIGLTINGVSIAMADPIFCPSGVYPNVSLRYIGYRTSDGYTTFSVKENIYGLRNDQEYWLSGYKMSSPWGRANYSTALNAIATGAKVELMCDGKYPYSIAVLYP